MSSVIVKFMWVVHNGHMEECTDMKERSVDRGQGIKSPTMRSIKCPFGRFMEKDLSRG